MKITKRIFAFTMAVIICVSFCMTHVAAARREFYEYTGNNMHIIDDATGSVAYVSCDIPGWNEETYTDFVAGTTIYSIDYGDDRNYYAEAYVEVSLYYEMDSAHAEDTKYAYCSANSAGNYANAEVDGNDLIDMDHGIEYVDTVHTYFICINSDGEYERIEQVGLTISVGTSY